MRGHRGTIPRLACRLALRLALLVLAAAVPSSAANAPEEGELAFTFIGNAAVEITDGKTVLVTDFPYQSGYHGYMTYPDFELDREGDVVCLITHEHRDHFEPGLFAGRGWAFIGAAAIAEDVEGNNVFALGDDDTRASYKDIAIEVLRTPHTDNHRSYIVSWHGLRVYVSGDTEDPSTLLVARDLDVAFVTPWLFDNARATGQPIDAERVIIYHHRSGERTGAFRARLVPDQGYRFTISY